MRRQDDSINKAVQTDIGRKDMDDVFGGARTDAISWEQRTVRLTDRVFDDVRA